jgi:DNA-binding PadR family transcriptional regulator
MSKSQRVPEVTHLQFLVMRLILDGVVSGRSLHKELEARGARMSRPAFYQLMMRLEDGKLLESWFERRESGGYVVRETHYRVTAPGKRAMQTVQTFYIPLVQAGFAPA